MRHLSRARDSGRRMHADIAHHWAIKHIGLLKEKESDRSVAGLGLAL